MGARVNKVLPAIFRDPAASEAAEALRMSGQRRAEHRAGPDGGGARTRVAGVLSEVASSFANFQVVAKREAEQRTELSVAPEVTAAVSRTSTRTSSDLGAAVAAGPRSSCSTRQ